jgi:sterol desaturase/sphingolipid hydroxylase (fatty acid hydroxylase superfamily)
MPPIFYASLAFFVLIAIELIASRLMKRKVYRLQDAITGINIGIISEFSRWLWKLASFGVYSLVVQRVAAFEWDMQTPWVWVVGFVLYDCLYYWAHRSGHEVNLLWAMHVTHHSGEDFNLATALRQSSTAQSIYWIFYLPMAILGIPLEVFIGVSLINLLYQYWVHTELIGTLGWMEKWFITPSNHRVHHGMNAYCIDRNYGGVFIVWDRFFGTYAAERKAEPVVYGSITPLSSWNPWWAIFKNFFDMWQSIKQTQHWKDKLMHVFSHPGWQPNGQTPIDMQSAVTRPKFNLPVTGWLATYGLSSFVTLYLAYAHWLALAKTQSFEAHAVYGIYLAAQPLLLGLLFMRTRGAFALEALRLVLVALALMQGLWFGAMPPWGIPLALTFLSINGFLLILAWRQGRQKNSVEEVPA